MVCLKASSEIPNNGSGPFLFLLLWRSLCDLVSWAVAVESMVVGGMSIPCVQLLGSGRVTIVTCGSREIVLETKWGSLGRDCCYFHVMVERDEVHLFLGIMELPGVLTESDVGSVPASCFRAM
jgi:hypothetical protein